LQALLEGLARGKGNQMEKPAGGTVGGQKMLRLVGMDPEVLMCRD